MPGTAQLEATAGSKGAPEARSQAARVPLSASTATAISPPAGQSLTPSAASIAPSQLASSTVGAASAIWPISRATASVISGAADHVLKSAVSAATSRFAICCRISPLSGAVCAAKSSSSERPARTCVPVIEPAEVPTISSAAAGSTPASRSPLRMPVSQATPTTPPPPITSARDATTHPSGAARRGVFRNRSGGDGSARPRRLLAADAAGAAGDAAADARRGRLGLATAARHRHVVAALRAEKDLAGPGDLLLRVFDHLQPLRHPARRAGDGEQHREHLRRQPHRLIDDAGVEVHVWVELVGDEVVVFERDPLQLQRDVDQRVAA